MVFKVQVVIVNIQSIKKSKNKSLKLFIQGEASTFKVEDYFNLYFSLPSTIKSLEIYNKIYKASTRKLLKSE